MVDSVAPEKIVDASAYLASTISGVRQAFGCGAGITTFPGGAIIQPAPSVSPPPEPFTHTSELPIAPALAWRSATILEVEWKIAMRLWLSGNDIANARRQAAPFYGRYLTAFAQNMTLGGFANSARITAFSLGGDSDSAWLDMVLSAWERVNLDNQPGPNWTT